MYAIISDSGKQFKVEEGQELTVDLRDSKSGDKVTFDRVLCIGGEGDTQLGKPTLTGASVTAEVLGVSQGPKLVIQKIRRRKNSRRKTGHRQMYTRLKIEKINAPE